MNDLHLSTSSGDLSLEYEWIDGPVAAPLLVFLHEGLGSVTMWRDWPRRLCEAGRFRGLMYSRPGYGGSTPRLRDEKWPVDYLHTQALEVLPAFLGALDIDTEHAPPWLIGHSDGASIALIHAAAFPRRVAGLVAMAPHVFVEDVSIHGIERARDAYVTTDTRGSSLAVKLARYHRDPDSAFWGWNDIWLDPAFRSWNIENLLSAITAPLLVVQGEDDEYGTMAQVDRIAQQVPHAHLLKLAQCGHVPHRDQSQRVTDAIIGFIGQH